MSFSTFVLSVISSIFLIFLFPEVNLSACAWVALVPFFQGISRARSMGQAALSGWIMGVIFFGVALFWMNEVSPIGWIILFLTQSVYFLIYGILAYEGRKIPNWFSRCIWLSVSWTLLEWIRAEIPVWGFGWNLLGYSQAQDRYFRQFANVVGVYGLTFVIVYINASIHQAIRHYRVLETMNYWRAIMEGKAPWFEIRHPLLNLGVLILVMSSVNTYGQYSYHHNHDVYQTLKVSVVQGNIPQDIKWDRMAREKIVEIYAKLTLRAERDKADLIVWPEAAFPGYLNTDMLISKVKDLIQEVKASMLIGAPYSASQDVAYNSAYLMNLKGNIESRYDKQYLVPFGEYVPWKPILGWLEPIAYSMGVSDFTAGNKSTVFEFKDKQVPFSTLICFEDLFPPLVRSLAKSGADFLVIITNDAWFGETAAPYQHLQASIFRAIENGMPIVRAANTGVSAFITRTGDVTSRVQNRDGRDIFVPGYKTELLYLGPSITAYRVAGFLFPYLIVIIFLKMFFKYKSLGWIFTKAEPIIDVEMDEA